MKGAGVFKIFRARIVFSGRFSFIKREGGREGTCGENIC